MPRGPRQFEQYRPEEGGEREPKRADAPERFALAFEHLRRHLSSKYNRVFQEKGRTYPLDYIGFHLDLRDEEVPAVMDNILGFTREEKGSVVIGYTLTDPDKALAYLLQILEEKQKQPEIPSVPLAKKVSKKREGTPLTAEILIQEPPPRAGPSLQKNEASIPISYEDLLDERNAGLYLFLWERHGDKAFSKDEIDFPEGFSGSIQTKSIRLASLEKAGCLRSVAGKERKFRLVPPDAKRELVRQEKQKKWGPLAVVFVFAPEPPPPDLEKIENALSPGERALYQYFRTHEGYIVHTDEENFPPEFKKLPWRKRRELLKDLWKKGLLERGYPLGATIQYPYYRLKVPLARTGP